MTAVYCALKTRAHLAKRAWKRIMTDERGDTNFISIIIILAVVVTLAGAFIGFGDQIIGSVRGIIASKTGQMGTSINNLGG